MSIEIAPKVSRLPDGRLVGEDTKVVVGPELGRKYIANCVFYGGGSRAAVDIWKNGWGKPKKVLSLRINDGDLMASIGGEEVANFPVDNKTVSKLETPDSETAKEALALLLGTLHSSLSIPLRKEIDALAKNHVDPLTLLGVEKHVHTVEKILSSLHAGQKS